MATVVAQLVYLVATTDFHHHVATTGLYFVATTGLYLVATTVLCIVATAGFHFVATDLVFQGIQDTNTLIYATFQNITLSLIISLEATHGHSFLSCSLKEQLSFSLFPIFFSFLSINNDCKSVFLAV